TRRGHSALRYPAPAGTRKLRNKVRRNGIARKSGPWSSYMLARVRSGEGVVPGRRDMRRQAGTPDRAWAAIKGLAKPDSGGGEPFFPWQNFGMVSEDSIAAPKCGPRRPQAIPAGRAGMRAVPIAPKAPNGRPRKKRQNGAARLPGTSQGRPRTGAPAGAADEAGASAACQLQAQGEDGDERDTGPRGRPGQWACDATRR